MSKHTTRLPESAAPCRWERQPGETGRQYATFQSYRDLHPLDRSLAEVGRKLGVSTSYCERLSARFGWVDRAAAFDREQDRMGQARRIREIREMNARHSSLAAAVLRKVGERVDALDSATLRPSEIARLLEAASRAERIGRGVLPDEPATQGTGLRFNADEVRRQLQEEGLLGRAGGNPASPACPSSVAADGDPWAAIRNVR